MDWFVELGHRTKTAFNRNIIAEIEQYDSFRATSNNTDVYATAYAYDSEDQSKANLFAPFYMDFDTDLNTTKGYSRVRRDALVALKAIERLYGIPEESLCLYFSGAKGFHLFVDPQIMDIKPAKNLNQIFKAMAQEIAASCPFDTPDMGIYDSRRLMRLNNSINSKTGLYKVQVTSRQLQNYTFEEMKEFASTPQPEWFPNPVTVAKAAAKYKSQVSTLAAKAAPKASTTPTVVPTKLLPCMQRLLDQGVQQGNRNQASIILASSLLQIGMNEKEMGDTIEDWNESKNEPSLPHGEISSIIRSASQMHAAGKKYGCQAVRDFDLCVSSCKLNK